MKNLWKYLSSLGLMFVAFLCLGIGLKTGEKAEAADVVYVDSHSTYTLSGGTISGGSKNGIGLAPDGNFIMNGGTVSSSASSGAAISGYQANITINSGSIMSYNTAVALSVYAGNVEINGGAIRGLNSYAISCPSASVTMNGGSIIGGINMGGGTVTYNGGSIDKIIAPNGDNGILIIFKKSPTSTITINKTFGDGTTLPVGNKIAKLVGISTIDLTKLNVTNMPSGCGLGISYINGSYWVVVVKTTSTISLTTNTSAARWTYNGQNVSSITMPSTATMTLTSNGTLVFNNGGTYTTATVSASGSLKFSYFYDEKAGQRMSFTSYNLTSDYSIRAYFVSQFSAPKEEQEEQESSSMHIEKAQTSRGKIDRDLSAVTLPSTDYSIKIKRQAK